MNKKDILGILATVFLVLIFVAVLMWVVNWIFGVIPCDKMINLPVTAVPTRCFRDYWTLETKDGLIMRFSGGNLSN